MAIGMDITSLACGDMHTVVVLKSGEMLGWGNSGRSAVTIGANASQNMDRLVIETTLYFSQRRSAVFLQR